MKKTFFLLMAVAFTIQIGYSQKHFTRDGKISFYSEAPLEKIEAHNAKATSVIDTENGRMEFAVLIKGFQFEKALMQEHFNENYMESNEYPKATFKGQIDDLSAVDFSKDGEYEVQVSGEMTIHGVTQPLKAPGTIVVQNGELSAKASFDLTVADYKIEIPAIVREKIAKVVSVVVEMDYEPLKKG
jgi:polyisoprenoid-binding protein YceI